MNSIKNNSVKSVATSEFIRGIPKAELHLHIEGSFEPELMMEFAQRHGVSLKYKSVEALKEAYAFNNLQEFLDIYYEGMSVLLSEQEFYDLTWAYLLKAKEENILHTEIFFDPQAHTDRGVPFEQVVLGIHRALEDGKEKLGVSSRLIMSFLRHLDEESAFRTLESALPYKDWIVGVGLDSSEMGNPPSKFERVFAKAREHGFLVVAHAGEEGPVDYIWEALDLLKVDRIDHGNRAIDSDELMKVLADKQIALTLCPLSNLELKVIDDLSGYPLIEKMERGLLVTINSDDPAYFGGYINQNYESLAQAIDLTHEHVATLAKNSFKASFLSDPEKEALVQKVDDYCLEYNL